MARKIKPKLYTLQEAYEEILRIKKDMGLLEYHQKMEEEAIHRGYAKALDDVKRKMDEEICFLNSLNVLK